MAKITNRAATAVLEHDLHNLAGDDELEAVPEPEHDPANVLQRLKDHFGAGHVLDEGELRQLLGERAFAAVKSAADSREIGRAESPIDHFVSGHRQRLIRIGYSLGKVVDLLRKKQVPVVETEVFQALLTITLDEALPLAQAKQTGNAEIDNPITNFRHCVEVLGLPGERLAAAIKAGKIIGDDGSVQHAGYLSLSALRRWIITDGIKPLWSGALAARIMFQRRQAKGQEEVRQVAAQRQANEDAANASNSVHQAFAEIEARDAADLAEMIAARRQSLDTYREIVLRRKNPLPGDAKDLADVCAGLTCQFADAKDGAGQSIAATICKVPGCDHTKFDRARVLADSAALDEAEKLVQLATTIGDCRAEVIAAGEARRETEKRHEAESSAAHKRVGVAFAKQGAATAAPGQLAELRRRHPHVFVS